MAPPHLRRRVSRRHGLQRRQAAVQPRVLIPQLRALLVQLQQPRLGVGG